ncbi:MAG: ABC transporter permease [Vicinamibacterales bacterium]
MLHDVRIALRSLLRAPGFTATTVLTLAIAAGANAAIFAIVYGVLIKPLPYGEPERLVAIWPGHFQSNADLLYLRQRAPSFSGVAAVAPGWSMSLIGSGDPTRVTVAKASGNLFDTLGTQPLLGRPFSESSALPGAAKVIVLSHDFWARRFAGDQGIIGRTINLDGDSMQVVAVMPRQFEVFGLKTDAFAPFPLDTAAWYHQPAFSLYVARLAPGRSVEQAGRDFKALIPEIRRERGYPADYGRTAIVADLRASMVGDLNTSLLVVAGAVGLILLIAGANIGTLQLTRAAARSRDLAVLSALGASRMRILRQLLVENATVAVAGGVLGVLVARVSLPLIIGLLPADMPRVREVAIEPLISGAVLLAGLRVGLSVGAIPAFASTRLRTAPLLRAASSSESVRAKRTRASLVSAEVALAVVLTISAGLMLQTSWRLERIDSGFRADQVLSLHLQPSGEKYAKVSVADYYEQIFERLRTVPGVAAVGAIQHLPFSGFAWNALLDIQGFAPAPGVSRPVAGLRIATPGYFAAIGQPLLMGREFERPDASRSDTVIINRALATRYFGSADVAPGRTLRIRGGRMESPWMTVIGVVGDVHHTALTTAAVPEIYTSVGKTTINAMMIAVRATGDPQALVPAVREAIWSIDRDVPVSDVQTMSARVGASLGRPRLLLSLLGSFAGAGLLLAVVGVYGGVAYSVTQRTRELGIMVALGAERARIMRTVLREAVRYAVAGLGLGIPTALLTSRVMKNVVWGVSATDPMTYVVITAGTLVVVCAASALPALRAARVDPVRALKGA